MYQLIGVLAASRMLVAVIRATQKGLFGGVERVFGF